MKGSRCSALIMSVMVVGVLVADSKYFDPDKLFPSELIDQYYVQERYAWCLDNTNPFSYSAAEYQDNKEASSSWSSVLKPTFDIGGFDVVIDVIGSLIDIGKTLFTYNQHEKRIQEFIQTYAGWSRTDFADRAQYDPLQYSSILHGKLYNRIERENNILSEHHLYQFPGFRDFIKDFLRYSDYLVELSEALVDEELQQKTTALPGYKEQSFIQIVQELAEPFVQECAQKDAEISETFRREEEKRVERKEHVRNNCRAAEPALQELLDDYAFELEEGSEQHERFAQRIQAIEASCQEDHAPHTDMFFISEYGKTACSEFLFNTAGYTRCDGSTIQIQIHSELVTILNAVAHERYTNSSNLEINRLTDSTARFIDVGRSYNEAGQIVDAFKMADACWELLECIKGVAEGVGLGLVQTATTFAHPYETVKGAVVGVSTAAYHLADLLTDKIALVITPEESGVHRLIKESNDEKYAKLGAMLSAAADTVKEMSNRERARAISSFATEWVATGYLFSTSAKFFNNARSMGAQYVQNVQRAEHVLVTAEGVEFGLAQKTADLVLQSLEHGPSRSGTKLVVSTQEVASKYGSEFKKLGYQVPGKKWLRHVKNKHFTDGPKYKYVQMNSGKKISVFNPNEDFVKLTLECLQKGTKEGNSVMHTFSKSIGYDKSGKLTSKLKVVVNQTTKSLSSAYPIKM